MLEALFPQTSMPGLDTSKNFTASVLPVPETGICLVLSLGSARGTQVGGVVLTPFDIQFDTWLLFVVPEIA